MTDARLDGFQEAGEQAGRLRVALAEIADGDDSFDTLDERDAALRALWRLGATKAALMTFTGMPATEIRVVVRGARPDGRRHSTRVVALLLTLAELS